MRKRIIALALAAVMTAGIMSGCGKKEPEKPAVPKYGEDAAYTKEVDNYMAAADATVETDYGNIALLDLTNTTSTFDPVHTSSPKSLIEALYLKDVDTTDKRNTEAKFITHFSYSSDSVDEEFMAAGFVFQSADVPQSVFMDKDNKIYKYYKIKKSGSFEASYLDSKKAKGDKFVMTENGKPFTTVYVIPYNGGYVYMETYSPLKRNNASMFGKITDKAKSSVGEAEWEVSKKLNKQIEKNRKAILTDKDKASLEQCDDRSDEIIKNMYLTRHDTEEEINDRREKASQSINILECVPVYKPENTLTLPELEEVTVMLRNRGYNRKDNIKKAKKTKHVLYYYDYKSRVDKINNGTFVFYDTNKGAKKAYKKMIKAKDGLEVYKVTGKNFKVAYSINKDEGTMWVVYLFNTKEENADCYTIDDENRTVPININDGMPRIIKFQGHIADVIKCMNTMQFQAESYVEDDE